jgi:serine phosphatase RsbU (regulator of sigma subunit)
MDAEPVSRLLQRSMLTRDAPQVRGYDIAAGTTLEAEGRGSTVWDSIVLPDGREALVMMDVRADGLPPAHLLGAARVALRAALPGAADLATALATVNDALAAVHVEGVDQFVECALLVPGAEEIEWACAGRIPAAILGRDATFTRLGSHGPPLGMMKGFGYGTERAPLGSGSAVLVLSGGGPGLFRGAADLVAEVQGRPAGKVVGTIHRAIRRALEGQEISVVFMRRH